MEGGEAEKNIFSHLLISVKFCCFFLTLISLIAARLKMQGIERHTFWAMLQDLR